MVDGIAFLGRWTRDRVERLGRFGRFFGRTFSYLFRLPVKFRRILERIHFIGTKSLWLITLISIFSGAVLALQAYYAMTKFGAESQVGTFVALAIIREIGPVICALMITGRAGSSLASELGIMQISEQFDALKIMGLNEYRYFMTPIFVASIVATFLLTAIFNVVGILGGYAVTGGLLGQSYGVYFGGIIDFVVLNDIVSGMTKSLVFGALIAWVCTYKGYHTGHGAEGVSQASTEAVVLSSVLILVSDYIMTSLMF
jgi:phospholipid/cholesterol/gamma-HCH transport system permease protein